MPISGGIISLVISARSEDPTTIGRTVSRVSTPSGKHDQTDALTLDRLSIWRRLQPPGPLKAGRAALRLAESPSCETGDTGLK
jgi:hypothetical protein